MVDRDTRFVFVFNLARFLFGSAIFYLAGQSLGAATFSISPSAINLDYSGSIALQVGGLNDGEVIRIEKFIDYNANGVANGIDTLVQSFQVANGHSSTIGGVTNFNRPGDLNAATGAITARLNFEHPDLQHFSGSQYLLRVSSPSGRFAATNAILRVTNSSYPQLVTGLVKSSGTNVPYAMAALLSGEANGRLVAGTFASTGGLFRLRPQPGTYQLIGLKKGFVSDLQNPVTFSLAAAATYSNNVQMIAGTRTISGQVVDGSNTNRVLRGMALFLHSSSNQVAIGFTDTNGLFSIAVTPGEWQVEPESDSAPLLGFTTSTSESRLTIDTSSGSVSNLVMALQPATALFYGTLKTSSNAPLPAVEMFADSEDHQFASRGTTGSQGNFCVGVTGTNWYLNASSEDLAFFGYLPPRGTNVSLTNGQAFQANFVVVPFAARLFGRVVDQNAAPVPLLRLSGSDSSGNYSSASSALDGRFNLGVGTGTWYMRLEDEEAHNRGLIWSDLSFNIRPGLNFSNINFVVRPATNSIVGVVRTPENDPVSGIELWATTTIAGTNYRSASSMTDASGSYLLYVPDGTWNVNANCSDWHYPYDCPTSLSVTVAVAKVTANIYLQPPPPPPPPPFISRPRHQISGQFRFEVYGTPNFRYLVEESSDLKFWTAVYSTNVYTSFFVVAINSPQTNRFYRLRVERLF